MFENKKTEMIFLIVLCLVAIISSVTVLVGFFIKDPILIINSSKFLSLSTLVLLTNFGYRVYKERHIIEEEVEVRLQSKEDVEEFKKQMDEHLQRFIKNIAEEEIEDKKDE